MHRPISARFTFVANVRKFAGAIQTKVLLYLLLLLLLLLFKKGAHLWRLTKKKTEENVTVEAGPDKPYTIAMNFQSEQKNSSTV